jgi:hypothetical protein
MSKLIVVMIGLFSIFNGFAIEPLKGNKNYNYDLVEKNLLIGLMSENEGLKTSSAYLLGEIKSTKAVIPLLSMLHQAKDKNIRILAALSLLNIGDERGLYAIKRAIIFDEDQSVRKMCTKFYNSYLLKENFHESE